MQKAVRYSLLAAALSLLVGVAGTLMVAPESRQAVWIGVFVALVFQLLLFVLFFALAFRKQPMLAYALGMLGRLFVVGSVALFWRLLCHFSLGWLAV